MITVIKNVIVYAPEYLGIKNVVVLDEKIEGIYSNINIPKDFIHITEIDGTGKIMFPGFIDGHVHIIGGGGENGFHTRTPEMKFTDITTSGITTVVGCLGTDNICRDLNSLIAKAKKMEYEGISTYCYTGSYEVPVRTITGRIKQDIMLIDKFIGVGEIALSDHRSSQPSFDQFVNLVGEARVAGLLSGKCGIVNVHLGAGKKRLDYLFSLIDQTEIPLTQLLPTHINRNLDLFNCGLKYAKEGGYIDLTTSCDPNHLEPGEVTASAGLKKYFSEGLDIEHITFSSDGNGSMAKFDDNGREIGLGVCSVKSLYEEVKKAILLEKIPIDIAIKVITSNVSKLLKLEGKGEIKIGMSADFVLVDDKTLEIQDVFAKGKCMVKAKEAIVLDTFH